MATLNITNGVRRNNPNATSAADSLLPNPNAGYGPYNSLDTAVAAVKSEYGGNVPLGVTVAVNVDGKLVEYWNNESTNEFVVKGGGGSGASDFIEVKSSDNSTIMYTNGVAVEEDSTTYLESKFPTVGTGVFLVDDVNGDVYLHYKKGGWIKFNATVLNDAAQVNARIVNASVLSFK